MTPQEKDLIETVFDRLARAGGTAKDSQAEAFIRDRVRQQPDAAYGLTQAVIVLEAGLNQAQQKISDLQRQLDEARGGAAGGSFLGGGSPWGNGSVPRSGAAPQPQQAYAPQLAYAPQPMAAPSGPWAQPGGGSSFLRNAATMAAGVAGGALIAEGLTSLFAGNRYGGGFGGGYGGGLGGPGIVEENVTVNNYYDDDRQGGGSGRDDSGIQDASYDDGGSSDDGGDFGTDV